MTPKQPSSWFFHRGLVVALVFLMATTAGCGSSESEPTATAAPPNTAAAATAAPTTTTAAPVTTTTPAAPNTIDVASELPEVVQQYYDALLDGDSIALAALFTADGVLEGVDEYHTRTPLTRPGVIAIMMGGWFSYVDTTDIEFVDVIAEGNTVVVVGRRSGVSSTHARGVVEKTPFSAPVVDVFELEDGLIARCDTYYEYDEIVN